MGVSVDFVHFTPFFGRLTERKKKYAFHFCRLLFTWGSNSFGQLGYGEFDTNEPLPKLAKKLATKYIVQIACGEHHNLALTNGNCKRIFMYI